MSRPALGACLLLLLGCDAGVEPGTFAVTFRWQEQPDESELYVFARVERPRDDGRRAIVAEADVARLEPDVKLAFETVPNGTGYVVVVEIKASQESGDRTLYFGESEPFALRAGKHTRVQVELALARTPGSGAGTAGAVTVQGAVDDGERLLVRERLVTLELRPSGATTVVAANDASFSTGRRETALEALSRSGDAYLWPMWDLNEGLGCSGKTDVCVSGLRRVFVRFVNDQGFESDLFSTPPIVLDGLAPSLAASSVAPTPARDGAVVVVRVEPSEALGTPPILTVTPDDPGFGEAIRLGQSYVFRYVVDERAAEDVDYGFAVQMRDAAGNESRALELDGLLRIDRSQPGVTGPAILDVEGTSGESFDFAVELFEELPVAPVVRVGGRESQCEPDPGRPTRYLCSHTPMGSEPDGTKAITVELVDAAGNVNSVEVGQILYDRTPPRVVNPVITPRLAGAGSRIQVRFGFDEPVHAVLVGGASFTQLASTGGELVFERVVADDEAEGEWDLTVSATDAWGNRAWALPIGSVVIDTTAPGIHSATVDQTRVTAGQRYLVRFRTTELLSAPARLRAGTSEVGTCERTPDALAEDYECEVVAPGPSDPGAQDGPQSLRAELVDAAGNAASVLVGSVVYDVELPAVVGATLLRDPEFAPAVERGLTDTTTHFSALDPFTREPVQAQLSIYANKPLLADPVLTVSLESDPTETLSFVLEDRQGENVRFLYTVRGDEPPGRYRLQIVFRDAAGSTSAPRVLPVFLELAFAPPVNDVDLGATVYSRAPWGTRATGAQPRFSVRGSVVTPSTATRVLVSSAPQPGAGFLLGQAGVLPDHSFDVPDLLGSDRVDLYVAVLDRAGNLSAYERVRLGEWVATLAGSGAGSASPHGFESWDVMPRVVAPQDGSAGAPQPGTALALADFEATDFSTHTRSVGGFRWSLVTSAASLPPPRENHSMVFDSARGRFVLFGGAQLNTTEIDSLWELDDRGWALQQPAGSRPLGRHDAAFVYDAGRAAALLFGGVASFSQRMDDLWAWDGTRWQQLPKTTTWPSARSSAGIAYDADRGRVVLLGGIGVGGVTLNDTWEWDGSVWHRIVPATTSPPGFGPMVYDAARRRVVLVRDEGTYEWDGIDWRAVMGVAGGLPYYDLEHGAVRALSVSGQVGDIAALREWNGQSWTVVGTFPVTFDGSELRLAYDSIRGEVVGACANVAELACSTYRLDESNGWRDASPGAVPSPRFSAVSTYDDARDRVILFGGTFIDGSFQLLHRNDTWAFDGRNWRCLAGECLNPDPGGSPPARRESALAYDPARDRVVLYGGVGPLSQLDDTWEWNGTSWLCRAGACTGLPLPTPNPGARHGHAMEYDQATGRIVMFGGYKNGSSAVNRANDTWEWDPVTARWNEVGTLTPPPVRASHTMDFDPHNGRLAVWGGFPMTDVLREWDATQEIWLNVTPAASTLPPMRGWHSGTTHRARERIVLWAGGPAGVELSDLWEFDPAGDRFHQIAQGTFKPAARGNAVLEYHAGSNKLLAFGGAVPSTLTNLGDTWLGDFDARPGHALRFDALALASGRTDVTLDGVTVLATAGGDGALGPDAAPGAALLLWDGYRWRRASCNDAPSGAPEDVSWSTRSPFAFQRMQSGEALRIAVSPVGGYGTAGPASLVTDYAELRVRYRVGAGTGASDPDDPGTPSGACPPAP